MSTLKEEILSLRESLKQLELGRRNVFSICKFIKIIMQPPLDNLWKGWSNLLLFRKDKLISLQGKIVIWKQEYLFLMKTVLHYSAW